MKRNLTALVLVLIIASCTQSPLNTKTNPEIHDIQGCSHTSPYNGQNVKFVEGIVTHKYQNGYSMQALEPDHESCTSEGIFIFTEEYSVVLPGDYVQVDGNVSEFKSGIPEDLNLSRTEIHASDIRVLSSDNEMPAPTIINSVSEKKPDKIIEDDGFSRFEVLTDGLDYYESLEFMLVALDGGIVVGPRNEFNEIVVLPDRENYQNLISRGGNIIETEFDQNPEKVMVKLPASYKGPINTGDLFDSQLIGIMDYSYGNYKIDNVNRVTFQTETISIEPFVPSAEQNLTIASYNLENLSLFDSEKKFSTVAGQIVQTLNSPNILVLHEIMDDSGIANDGTIRANETLQRLVDAIEEKGGPIYSYSDNPPENNQDGGIQGGNIRTILLYRTDKGLKLENTTQLTDDYYFDNGRFLVSSNPFRIGNFSGSFLNARKPIVWLFEKDGLQFFVIGCHLTSQGANTPLWGSQQPPQRPEEEKRNQQARFLSEFTNKILTYNPELPLIIAGDMNDSPWSKTLKTLAGTEFINLGELEKSNERYSYVFEGNALQLDYVLLNKRHINSQTRSQFVHFNTSLDSNNRISDHDPVIVEISLKD